MWLWLWGCSTEAPTLTTLPTGSPAAMLAACDKEPYPELAIGCRVEAAGKAGDVGDIATITAACAAVPEGKWRFECHFRAGEQLGKAGHTDAALEHCGKAGEFGRFCLTHAGWGLPASDPRTPAELAALAAIHLPPKLVEDGAGVLRARGWYNRFVGTGTADAAVAAAAVGEDGPPARTAWAIEALRLSGDLTAARASWPATVLTGTPLPLADRVGRYDTLPSFGAEGGIPRTPVFGDAWRLIGESEGEDVDIALIEAQFFLTQDGDAQAGAAFETWLDDPRPRVRYSALRRYRTLPSERVELVLTALAADADATVAAHAADGIKHRTWLGKQKR